MIRGKINQCNLKHRLNTACNILCNPFLEIILMASSQSSTMPSLPQSSKISIPKVLNSKNPNFSLKLDPLHNQFNAPKKLQ